MFFLLTLLIQILVFLPVSLSAEDYRFSRLTMEDGLSSNSVYCMTQDSQGYLWFGTFSGLNRYDGQNMITFRPATGVAHSISGSVIFSILEDSSQRIWIGTDGGGLNLFNNETLDFSSFRNDPENPVSLPSNQVFALEEDRAGRLWIGTAGGGLALYRGDGQFFILNKKNSALISNRIRTLYCDPGGILWIGTEKGLSLYNTNTGGFPQEETVPGWKLLDDHFIRSIVPDDTGRLWIGTGSGLYLYDGVEISPFPLPETTDVRCITTDEKHLWIGTERSGIFLYTFSTGEWTILSEEPGGISYNKIRSLYKDPEGLILVGSRGGGVNIFNPGSAKVTTYTHKGPEGKVLKNPHIRQMEERTDGSIWVATDGGGISVINRKDGTITWEDVNAADTGSENDQVYSLLEDRAGRFWIGTDGSGLFMIPPGGTMDNIQSIPLPVEPNSESYGETIWAILEDEEGVLWIGTEGKGLFSFDHGKWTQYRHEPGVPGKINGNAVRCIFEDSRKRLWIGTWDGGLNYYRKESDSFISFVRSPVSHESLSDNSVNVISEDTLNRLWIGTAGGGVNIFNPEEKIFRTLSSRDGLSGDNIYGILEDNDMNIWVSTDKGLSRITPGTEKILNFSAADGLAANEFSQNAFLKTRDGTLFWGGPEGISSFHPEAMSPAGTSHARIMFTGLSIHNLPVSIGQMVNGRVILDKEISLKDEIILPHTANNLTFQFSILSYIDPEKHQFSAQMKGLEERPRFLGNRNQVSYASVPPGIYDFTVFGTDHNGRNSQNTLKIRILAPFWMNLWFYIGDGFFLLLIISLIVWLRLRGLSRNNAQLRSFSMHMEQAREEERKAAARDYHDELGQQLTAIKFDLFWLNSHPDAESGIRKDKISRLLDMVNDSIDSVRTISTNLRPKALDNLTLKEALEWQSRRFRKRTGIPLDLTFKLKGTNFPEIGIEGKTALFRMYQEILTNIIRHAEATKVEVRFIQDRDTLCLIVIDNGVGITREKITRENSFGLIGMRERCRHLKGTFFIDNYSDGGTIVKIILPVIGGSHA